MKGMNELVRQAQIMALRLNFLSRFQAGNWMCLKAFLMKTKIFSIIALLFLALVSCSNKQIKAEVKHPKILVVYFSQGGNTKMLASTIKESTGGDLFSIEPTPPYPSGDIHGIRVQDGGMNGIWDSM